MLLYILKRILTFVPTLLVISLLVFGLSKLAEDDLDCGAGVGDTSGGIYDIEALNQACAEKARELNLDKPTFYCKITSAAYPKNLHEILKKKERQALEYLVAQHGNWPQIKQWREGYQALDLKLSKAPDSLSKKVRIKVRAAVKSLYIAYNTQNIGSLLSTINKEIRSDEAWTKYLIEDYEKSNLDWKNIHLNKSKNLLYWPKFYWYGLDNQYHHWFSNFFGINEHLGFKASFPFISYQPDFGKSMLDYRPVVTKIKEAAFWTILLNILSLFFTYLISIPVGVFASIKKDKLFDRLSGLFVFILFSLPSFWIATLVVVFFTTPEYGMNWFPSVGLGKLPSDAPFWNRFYETGKHFILPVMCLTYASFAFLSRQMRGGKNEVLRQDYIRTARAKGLEEKQVVWKHAFKNALFPIVTLFASIFPRLLAGSVIIEIIFAIPGMGRLIFNSILARDWPVVYAALMIAAILTMIGILVADIILAKIDPRISFGRKS